MAHDQDISLSRSTLRRQLAGIGIRRADRRAQLHRGVRGKCVFNHLGVDVVAAADDQVLGAAGQVQAFASLIQPRSRRPPMVLCTKDLLECVLASQLDLVWRELAIRRNERGVSNHVGHA